MEISFRKKKKKKKEWLHYLQFLGKMLPASYPFIFPISSISLFLTLLYSDLLYYLSIYLPLPLPIFILSQSGGHREMTSASLGAFSKRKILSSNPDYLLYLAHNPLWFCQTVVLSYRLCCDNLSSLRLKDLNFIF